MTARFVPVDLLPSEREVYNRLRALFVDYERGFFTEAETIGRILDEVPSISLLQGKSFRTADEKGWWPDKPTDAKALAEKFLLMVTEVAEAFEDVRVHRRLDEVIYVKKVKTKLLNPITGVEEEHSIEYVVPKGTEGAKPCGILSELADVVIRILDFCGAHKLDLQGMILEKMAFNDTREFRHGGKAA